MRGCSHPVINMTRMAAMAPLPSTAGHWAPPDSRQYLWVQTWPWEADFRPTVTTRNQLIFGVEMGRVWFRNFQICLWCAKVKSAWNWWRKQRLQLDPRIPPVTVIFPEKLGRSMTNRSFCHFPSKKRYWICHVRYVPLYHSQTKVIG